MGKHFIRIAAAALFFSALVGPASADAQTVMVLGVGSSAGDDEFTTNFTGALRNAASRVQGWELNGREVSLAQMTLAHGCVEPDVHCMAEIGGTLGVDLIIYGMVTRTSTSANHDFAVSLYLFDNTQGAIRDQLTDTVPRVHSDIDDLRSRARRYISQFSGAEQTGRIQIQTNIAGAEVVIDGEVAGTTTGGQFEAVVSVGQHRVEVRAEGHSTFRGSVSVARDSTASIEAELIEGDEDQIIVAPPPGGEQTDSGGANIGAIVSFSVAGVAAVMTAVSWAMISSTQSDLDPWRTQAGMDMLAMGIPVETIQETNACDFMKANNVPDPEGGGVYDGGINLCSQGETWFAVQVASLVTLGAGLISGTLFMVLGGDDDEEDPSSDDGIVSDVSIAPSFSPYGGFLSASGRF